MFSNLVSFPDRSKVFSKTYINWYVAKISTHIPFDNLSATFEVEDRSLLIKRMAIMDLPEDIIELVQDTGRR